MTGKQLNPFVDVLATCRGDRRYRGEVAAEDCLLVGVLAGELRVVQAHHTHTGGPGSLAFSCRPFAPTRGPSNPGRKSAA
ncbi:hypothetical protein EJV47_00675 [Hymenobacter gummosus]|uniref:Uncharacterized protein n=1 Tax=Hymenobacter gummosus TaxID=1776032 RepID=A0A3S0HC66_9BACT|nr:hypothetical protein [Hymenobacter gummosus]RTQ53285.1 hypothetical protein EJV47_00675 [Hymenobacter gummosus]